MLPLLMVAAVVLSVLGAGALTIGRLGAVRHDLQNAADAVALQAAYRLERFGLPTDREPDLAPAAALAQGNLRQPVRVRWVHWGDEGARPRQYAYVRIEVETRSPFVPTSTFRELLALSGTVRASAHARVDQDIFAPGDLECMYINNRYVHKPLGCRVGLTRAVTDRYQLTPHAFRRDGSGREQRVPLRDYANGKLYLDVNECESFVAIGSFSCAPRSGSKLVVRYNRPLLAQ